MSSVPEKFTGLTIKNADSWDKPVKQQFEPKVLNKDDVTVKITACSVCGTDHHVSSGSWMDLARNDLVVGHEIVGTVIETGSEVSEFKIGDIVGVGAAVTSCGSCEMCLNDDEQYCSQRISTYNQPDPFSDGYVTQGGYASHIRTNERFVFKVPKELKPEEAAPFFCSGLTVYSPLVRNIKTNKPQKVGIIGIGGLGHMAIQFANKMGAEVYAFSRSSKKREEAIELGAKDLIASGEAPEWYKDHAVSFDLILNCATSFSGIDMGSMLKAVKPNGKIIGVGLPNADEQFNLNCLSFGFSSVSLSGSILGSKKECVEMLEFAVKNNIRAWTEEFPINEENYSTAMTRISKSDVHYRIVLTDFEKFFD